MLTMIDGPYSMLVLPHLWRYYSISQTSWLLSQNSYNETELKSTTTWRPRSIRRKQTTPCCPRFSSIPNIRAFRYSTFNYQMYSKSLLTPVMYVCCDSSGGASRIYIQCLLQYTEILETIWNSIDFWTIFKLMSSGVASYTFLISISFRILYWDQTK